MKIWNNTLISTVLGRLNGKLFSFGTVKWLGRIERVELGTRLSCGIVHLIRSSLWGVKLMPSRRYITIFHYHIGVYLAPVLITILFKLANQDHEVSITFLRLFNEISLHSHVVVPWNYYIYLLNLKIKNKAFLFKSAMTNERFSNARWIMRQNRLHIVFVIRIQYNQFWRMTHLTSLNRSRNIITNFCKTISLNHPSYRVLKTLS